ncbi:MAG: serine acetyltransferase, partial [Prevotella sp.]|nr:serine acetyltransferase [Prevotella sp.]
AHLQAVVFPEYYPLTAAPQTLELPDAFWAEVPSISRLIHTDVDAVLHNDPAVSDLGEVILSYPLTFAMMHYRTAHVLYNLGVPRIPRMLTELAHSRTGIDIHPAAQIGDHFCIDHGTGVVIGETAIIGSHVVLYQGVTLGAKSFEYDEEGLPMNVPRHPILEDHVTVYSNTSILGRVRIGHDTIIGGNIWLTQDIPANSLVLQSNPEIRIKNKV